MCTQLQFEEKVLQLSFRLDPTRAQKLLEHPLMPHLHAGLRVLGDNNKTKGRYATHIEILLSEKVASMFVNSLKESLSKPISNSASFKQSALVYFHRYVCCGLAMVFVKQKIDTIGFKSTCLKGNLPLLGELQSLINAQNEGTKSQWTGLHAYEKDPFGHHYR